MLLLPCLLAGGLARLLPLPLVHAMLLTWLVVVRWYYIALLVRGEPYTYYSEIIPNNITRGLERLRCLNRIWNSVSGDVGYMRQGRDGIRRWVTCRKLEESKMVLSVVFAGIRADLYILRALTADRSKKCRP